MIGRVSALHAGSVALASVLFGCGAHAKKPPDADTTPDAGPPIAAPPDITPPTPPDAPMAFDFSCAPGWTQNAQGACDPFAFDVATCTNAELALPGAASCTPVSSACPPDGIPVELPTDRRILHVDPSAPPGGDGSAAHPFASASDALTMADATTTVALHPGTYVGSLTIAAGVEVVGACASGVRIDATGAAAPAVTLTGAGAKLSQVTVVGGPRSVLVAHGGSATLSHAILLGAALSGIYVDTDARLTADAIAIRDVGAPTGAGAGIDLIDRSQTTLSQIDVARVAGIGVHTHGNAAMLTLSDAVVRDARAGTMPGAGVSIDTGGSATLRRVVVQDSADFGIYALHGTLDLADVVVQRITSDTALLGEGIDLQQRSTMTAERVWVNDVRTAGLILFGPTTHATMASAIVSHVAEDASAAQGYGIWVGQGAIAELAGATVQDTMAGGVFAFATSSSLTMSDVEVSRTGGRGLEVAEAASVDLSRCSFEHAAGTGIFCGGSVGPGTMLAAHDVSIAHVARVDASRGYGTGIVTAQGCASTIERARISDVGETGIAVSGQAICAVSDASIDGVTAFGDGDTAEALFADDAELTANRIEASGVGNDALVIQSGASVTLDSATLELGHDYGILVSDGSLSARDVALAAGPSGGGMGVFIQRGSTADLTRLTVAHARTNGIVVLSSGTVVTLQDVLVEDSVPIDDGSAGGGIYAGRGATLDLARVQIARCSDAALIAWDEGTVVRGATIAITDTRQRTCASSACAGFASGIGATALSGASLSLTSFDIERAALSGGLVADGGALDLHHGRIAHAPIGVNVEIAGYDYSRVTTDVEFVDDARNVDSSVLPVPETSIPPI